MDRSAVLAPPAAPDVSVCVVNWNCRDLLRKCLRSLLAQPQDAAFEVVVVDNASTDGAADLVEREFPQVRLLRNSENLGFSRANNQAARLAAGRYLFFLNNDTEMAAGTLGEFVRFADRNPGVGMVGPRLRGRRRPWPRSATAPAPPCRPSCTGSACCGGPGCSAGPTTATAGPPSTRTHTRPVDVLMGAAVFLPREVFDAERPVGRAVPLRRRRPGPVHPGGRRRHKQVVYFSRVEVLHHGRVASRANVGFSQPNVAVGYVHYFRKAGVGRGPLLVYKLLVTLDTPVQLAAKTVQGCWRKLLGRPDKAAKSWLAARGVWGFMRGELGQFWRA